MSRAAAMGFDFEATPNRDHGIISPSRPKKKPNAKASGFFYAASPNKVWVPVGFLRQIKNRDLYFQSVKKATTSIPTPITSTYLSL
jgi:hypothetical protein